MRLPDIRPGMTVLTLRFVIACLSGLLLAAPALAEKETCAVSLMVLGAGQDGGKPQIATPDDPAWTNPDLRRLATSLALVDTRGGRAARWLFEATPDIKAQLQRLDERHPVPAAPGLDGIFLTHAHIGHYTGLALLGHESAGAEGVPVHALPRMAGFLRENGPWGQLVRYENIALNVMTAGEAVELAPDLTVTPFLVPHRQEYSEVAGYSIAGPDRSVLFIPDIDSWADWDAQEIHIEDQIAAHDMALLDGTFFARRDTRPRHERISPPLHHGLDRTILAPAGGRTAESPLHPSESHQSRARHRLARAGVHSRRGHGCGR